MPSLVIEPTRLEQIRPAYSLRAVPRRAIARVLRASGAPRAGDILIARVESIGHHKNIELATGRKAQLYVGDEIAVCYGNRYAPDQFEAEVPVDLGPCHLVAAGGLAGRVRSAHERTEEPTVLHPVGLVAAPEGGVLNLRSFGRRPASVSRVVPVVAVVGTAMNAGKTTAASAIVRGLVSSGLRVGAAKATGTGAGNDVWSMRDAGAEPVFDFTDMGVPSTYLCDMPELRRIFLGLLDALGEAEVDVAVMEVADGLNQRETAMLIDSDSFRRRVGGVVFAAYDAMGAAAGVRSLWEKGLPVLAVSGRLTQSPLATREAAAATALPVVAPIDLHSATGPIRAIVDAVGCASKAARDPALAATARLNPPLVGELA